MDLLWSTACTFPPFAISKFRRVRLRSIRPFSFARSQPFSVHRLWCSLLWAVVNPHFAWKCRTCFCASISGSFEGSHIPSFPGPSLLRFRHVGSWRKSNYILSYHLPFVFGTRASPLLKIHDLRSDRNRKVSESSGKIRKVPETPVSGPNQPFQGEDGLPASRGPEEPSGGQNFHPREAEPG